MKAQKLASEISSQVRKEAFIKNLRIGAPQGFPFIPVIKVSGNRNTVKTLVDFIDLDISQVLLKGESLESAGSRVLEYSLRSADGHTTEAETIV